MVNNFEVGYEYILKKSYLDTVKRVRCIELTNTTVVFLNLDNGGFKYREQIKIVNQEWSILESLGNPELDKLDKLLKQFMKEPIFPVDNYCNHPGGKDFCIKVNMPKIKFV